MQLKKDIITKISGTGISLPAGELFSLPEKVLQFGTGVLLRGLPDYFIDKANKQGVFNGRIVVIKSTSNGGTDAFAKQDGLYTLLERGVVNGKQTEKTSINASISRVLSANEDWEKILQCAGNAEMQLILSNTTEVGITLVEEDAKNDKPVSFPGRLLFFSA
jgi:tagaturonate reductase